MNHQDTKARRIEKLINRRDAEAQRGAEKVEFVFSLRLRVSAVKTQLEFSHGYLKLVANRSSSFYAPSIMDTNYWGLWCVPVGLLLFLPALIAAVKAKPEDPTKHSKLPPPK